MSPSREDILTLPNSITLARIGSIPIIVALMYLDGAFWGRLTGLVFFFSGLTDLLDGWLARRMKTVSKIGQFLDPVADKLLVSSLLIVLVDLERAPAWVAIAIIAREIAVTGIRAVAATSGFTVPSDMLGKSKTAVQMLALLLLILHYPIAGFDPQYWGMVALWVALGVTAWSGIGYFVHFHKKLKESHPD